MMHRPSPAMVSLTFLALLSHLVLIRDVAAASPDLGGLLHQPVPPAGAPPPRMRPGSASARPRVLVGYEEKLPRNVNVTTVGGSSSTDLPPPVGGKFAPLLSPAPAVLAVAASGVVASGAAAAMACRCVRGFGLRSCCSGVTSVAQRGTSDVPATHEAHPLLRQDFLSASQSSFGSIVREQRYHAETVARLEERMGRGDDGFEDEGGEQRSAGAEAHPCRGNCSCSLAPVNCEGVTGPAESVGGNSAEAGPSSDDDQTDLSSTSGVASNPMDARTFPMEDPGDLLGATSAHSFLWNMEGGGGMASDEEDCRTRSPQGKPMTRPPSASSDYEAVYGSYLGSNILAAGSPGADAGNVIFHPDGIGNCIGCVHLNPNNMRCMLCPSGLIEYDRERDSVRLLRKDLAQPSPEAAQIAAHEAALSLRRRKNIKQHAQSVGSCSVSNRAAISSTVQAQSGCLMCQRCVVSCPRRLFTAYMRVGRQSRRRCGAVSAEAVKAGGPNQHGEPGHFVLLFLRHVVPPTSGEAEQAPAGKGVPALGDFVRLLDGRGILVAKRARVVQVTNIGHSGVRDSVCSGTV